MRGDAHTFFLQLSGKRDSNSRPSPWQGDALPTELLPLKIPLLAKQAANLMYQADFTTGCATSKIGTKNIKIGLSVNER